MWTFETQKALKASHGAQVVNISPKPDSEVALMTLLRIKFDRPMASDWYGFSAGQTTFNERPCRVLRGWASLESWWSRTKTVGSFNESLVDDETGLVVLTRHGRMSSTQFLYESVNEDQPPTLFAVPQAAGLVRSPVEPLGEGYDVRFLNVIDGTNGRVSVRWGNTGKRADKFRPELTRHCSGSEHHSADYAMTTKSCRRPAS